MVNLLTLGLLAATLADPAPNPVAWSLRPGQQRPVRAGQTVTVHLVADIQAGWHLYSLEQPPGGPIATEIFLSQRQPFVFARPIGAPTPHAVFDPTFGMPVQLYTGKADFALPIKVAATAPPGPQALSVEVRYQTCDGVVCLPPRRITLHLTLDLRD